MTEDFDKPSRTNWFRTNSFKLDQNYFEKQGIYNYKFNKKNFPLKF